MAPAPKHRLLTAEVLSIGTELTVGDTRDTNAGELARGLTALGVRVARLTALPDDLDVVTEAFKGGISRVDLVISTGGLGPTPDDLTREAIAAASGEAPAVDPDLEAWLRELWSRRGMPFPELNLKQAWLIASARALPNPNGTAPGWFVVRPEGRVIVALPGPPREMRPMWADHALPLLRDHGLGTEMAARTYRLAGIGESQVAERLGESLLRAANPIVATYARVEAVDVRISATAEPPRTADQLVDEAEKTVLDLLGEHLWATGETTWSEAIGARLEELRWTLAAVEIGTGGSLGALLGDAAWFRFDEIISPEAPAASSRGVPNEPHGAPNGPHAEGGAQHGDSGAPHDDDDGDDLLRFARRARELGGSEVGVAVRARSRTGDTAVSIAVSTPTTEHNVRRVVFLTGPLGRSRSALAAAAVVLETLNSLVSTGTYHP
jgi:nicotinamide-nucleotide amidase